MHGLIEECLRSVPEVAHAIARDEGLVPRRVARAIARGGRPDAAIGAGGGRHTLLTGQPGCRS